MVGDRVRPRVRVGVRVAIRGRVGVGARVRARAGIRVRSRGRARGRVRSPGTLECARDRQAQPLGVGQLLEGEAVRAKVGSG